MVTRLAKSFVAIKKAVLHNIAQNPFDMSPIPEEFKLQDELNKMNIEEDAIGIEAAFCALHTLSVDRFLMRAPSRSEEGPQCSEAKVSDMTRFVARILRAFSVTDVLESSLQKQTKVQSARYGLATRYGRKIQEKQTI